MTYLAQHGRYLGEIDRVLTDGLDYFNILDYGAVDGAIDNRAAVIAAYTAALARGPGGIVWIPRGEWNCKITAAIPVFLLSGSGSQRLIFMGEGSASHLMMSGDGGSTDKRLFDIKSDCFYVGFKDLRVDSVLTNEDPQQHLIHWECPGTSLSLEAGRGFIHDVEFGHTRGDCVRFLGNVTRRVNDIDIRRVVGRFTGAVRSRTLISFQRSTDGITMDSCYGDGAGNSGSIDMEPTGTGSNERNLFLNNYIVGQPSLTGNGANNEHRFSCFLGNTILGSVDGLDIENMIIAGNIVQNDQVLTGIGAFAIFERIHNVSITGNVFKDGVGSPGGTFTVSIFNHSVGENHEILIKNNIVVNEVNAGTGAGINMQYVKRSTVSGNLVSIIAGTSGSGIRFEVPTRAETQGDLVCHGNMVLSPSGAELTYGVSVGQGNFSVMNCLFRHCTTGVTVVGTRTGEYLATQNVMLSVSNGLRILDTSYVAIGGAGHAKGPTTYQVIADAEGLVTACPGSLALQSTGGTAGNVLKVKESSPTPSTGWIGK